METFLIRLLQFILAISLLVLLHEGGHMFFAKLFGVRVEKFFIFFDVSIGKWKGALFHWKPKNSDTDYGIGWLPLGGYCKIAGMIDESMDTEQMKQPEQPWEFRTKPAWQRLLIMIGGVLVNFLLALFIYSMIMFTWGEDYYSVPEMKMGMKFNTEAKALGFQDHDILLRTNEHEFRDFANVNGDMFRYLAEAKEVYVLRNGKEVKLNLPGNLDMLQMIKKRPLFAYPYLPSEIDSVMAGTPAAKLGLKKGDRIMAINGNDASDWSSFNNEIGRRTDIMSAATSSKDSLKARTITLTYHEAGAPDSTAVRTQVTLTPDMKFGFVQSSLATYYKPQHQSYGFFESFPAGTEYGINILKGYISNFKYLFSSDGAKSLGGFGAIGSLFPPVWDWQMFWTMTAFLSIMLAFMNIIPIPALDGGHVLFLLWEIITRRKPSDKFMIYAEYVGMGLLIVLMLLANANDVLRWLGYM